MMLFKTYLTFLVGLVVLAGCASSNVSERQYLSGDVTHARPGRIIVYAFKATASEVPGAAGITGSYSRRESPQTPAEIQTGRKLGAFVAKSLVREIMDMGMPAQRAGRGPAPQIGDVVITGQFIMIDEGDKTKRVLIGFGKGASELKTHVEGYLITKRGARLLGTRQFTAKGGKKPGALVPGIMTVATGSPVGLVASSLMSIKAEKKGGSETLKGAAKRTAKEIAKELKKIFQEQGWI